MQPKTPDYDSLTQGLRTKSDKIRALARAGVATADIARHLGIRYQHARNVLMESGLHRRLDEAAAKYDARVPARSGDVSAWTNIETAGRMQIPEDVMKTAGIGVGDRVHVRVSDDGIEILSRRAALRRAQAIARKYVPEGVSLVDDLIEERRREAALGNE